eukprot:195427_1
MTLLATLTVLLFVHILQSVSTQRKVKEIIFYTHGLRYYIDTNDPKNWCVRASCDLQKEDVIFLFEEWEITEKEIVVNKDDLVCVILIDPTTKNEINRTLFTAKSHAVPMGTESSPDNYILELPGCFFNHSCDPNSYDTLSTRLYKGQPNIECRARKPIKKGTEITYDYAWNFFYVDEAQTFDCICNSPSCRGEFRGFVALSEQQKKDIYLNATEYVRSQ